MRSDSWPWDTPWRRAASARGITNTSTDGTVSLWMTSFATSLAAAAVVVLGYCIPLPTVTTLLETKQQHNSHSHDEHSKPVVAYQIPVSFLDRLASKSYLHWIDPDTRSQSTTTNRASEQRRRATGTEPSASSKRPVGIPATLRLLTVDLPDVRHGFSGGPCGVATDRVFPDGIAPPRRTSFVPPPPGSGSSRSTTTHPEPTGTPTKVQSPSIPLTVEQKAWVTSVYECVNPGTGRVAVQVMEANTASFNINNVRKTKRIGNFEYDPTAYGPQRFATTLVTTPSDELQAPWNQYAWKEEVRLRVSGQVRFGEPLRQGSRSWWQRLVAHTGIGATSRSVYQATVPPQPVSWSERGLSLLGQRPAYDTLAGRDGCDHTWAGNQPHAVVANGAALHRVPHALKYLQQTCREHNVPLYVIRDPRVWGANTSVRETVHTDGTNDEDNDDVGAVLREVRKYVKGQLVTNSLRLAAGTAFARGRWVGQSEAHWQHRIETVQRLTQERLERAREQRRTLLDRDWSQLDAVALERKLVEKGALCPTNVAGTKECTETIATAGLLDLAKRLSRQNEEDADTVLTNQDVDDGTELAAGNDEGTKDQTDSKVEEK